MNRTVRRLAREEVPAYRALMLGGYAGHPEAFTSTPEERSGLPDSWWEKRMGTGEASPRELVIGAFCDGDLAGAAGLKFTGREKHRHKAELFGMIVAEAWRGHGLGRAIVEAVLSEARGRDGVELVQLTVSEGNEAAEALYRSCGFERFGVEPMAMKQRDGQYVAKVHMWCRLGAPT